MGATFPTASAVIEAARSQIGETEHPANSNLQKFGKAFGWNGVAWCGQFVWWAFFAAGVDIRALGIPHPSYTPSFFVEAQKAGWKQVPPHEIRRGDVLFYDFVAPFNTSGIQHTGLALTDVEGVQFHDIEGNTSTGEAGSQDNGGIVAERTRNLPVLVGAVRPPYSPEGKRKRLPLPKPKKPSRLLKLGDVGADVKALQTMLNRRSSDQPKLVADGVFGPRTDTRVRVYQRRHFLTVDGEAGPKTVYSLWS